MKVQKSQRRPHLVVTPDGVVRVYESRPSAEYHRADDEVVLPTPTTVEKITVAWEEAIATRARIFHPAF